MHLIETSLFASQRGVHELQALVAANLTTIVEPMTYMGTPRRSVNTYMDDFERLITVESERCASQGIEHLTLLGVPALDAGQVQAARQAVELLPRYLGRPGVLGIGEVGFERFTEEEAYVLRLQMRTARDMGVPIVIQAPVHEKARAVSLSLRFAEEEGLERRHILVKGLDEETLRLVKRFGAWSGLTIHPSFLSQDAFVDLVGRYGTEGLMVQSDAGRGLGDPNAVPTALERLAHEGLSREDRATLVYHNPKWFYSQGLGQVKVELRVREFAGASR